MDSDASRENNESPVDQNVVGDNDTQSDDEADSSGNDAEDNDNLVGVYKLESGSLKAKLIPRVPIVYQRYGLTDNFYDLKLVKQKPNGKKTLLRDCLQILHDSIVHALTKLQEKFIGDHNYQVYCTQHHCAVRFLH